MGEIFARIERQRDSQYWYHSARLMERWPDSHLDKPVSSQVLLNELEQTELDLLRIYGETMTELRQIGRMLRPMGNKGLKPLVGIPKR